jgi:hypothetical protein
MTAVRAGGQDIEDQPGHAVPGGMTAGVGHQSAGDPVTAVRRADVEPFHLGGASAGQGGKADAAGGMTSEVGDQEVSRRAVDILQAGAFTLEHGGKLTDTSWHWPPGLSLSGCHVLEDHGDSGAAPAGRECARHDNSDHAGCSLLGVSEA